MRLDRRLWDVIVVGGGPAGATAARHCARQGLDTLVLEKAFFPRPKVCAGGVTSAALREIGLLFPPEILEREGRLFRPRWGREYLDIPSRGPFVYMVSRDRFDQHLLWAARQAGAEVKEGVRVTGISVENDRVVTVTPERSFSARAIVGADGVRSRVARAVRPDFGPTDTGLCLAAEIPTTPAQRIGLLEDGIEVRYGVPRRGYGWVFPKSGRVSVGVGAVWAAFRRPGSEFLRFLNGSSLAPPAGTPGDGWDLVMLRGRLRAHLVPLGGRRRPVARGNVALVGDAAGFADPFTGEGIRWGCLSGRLAAEAVARGLKAGRLASELAGYERAAGELIDQDLAWARWLTGVFARWPEAASRLFFRRPAAFDGLINVLRGDLTYRAFILSLPARWLRGAASSYRPSP